MIQPRVNLRNRMDKWHPAEKKIQDAVWEIEKMPASPMLTEAQILLSKARDWVAEYIVSSGVSPTPEPKESNGDLCKHDWIEYKQCCYCGAFENYKGQIIPSLKQKTMQSEIGYLKEKLRKAELYIEQLAINNQDVNPERSISTEDKKQESKEDSQEGDISEVIADFAWEVERFRKGFITYSQLLLEVRIWLSENKSLKSKYHITKKQ